MRVTEEQMRKLLNDGAETIIALRARNERLERVAAAARRISHRDAELHAAIVDLDEKEKTR